MPVWLGPADTEEKFSRKTRTFANFAPQMSYLFIEQGAVRLFSPLGAALERGAAPLLFNLSRPVEPVRRVVLL
jgi:hypothetical protein